MPEFLGISLEVLLAEGKEALEEIQDEVTGEIVDTYQAIVDIWEIDCQGSWTLWVKTGVQALGASLYLILVPSFEEVLENYLEPKPGRTGSRRGRPDDRDRVPAPGGGKRVRFRPGIPDIDAEIASLLPGAEFLEGRPGSPGEWIFWKAVNTADRVLWYWLLAEVTQTFFTTWMSGMMESGRCQAQNEGSCQFTTPIRNGFINPELWFNKTDLVALFEENMAVHNNGNIELASGVHIADWLLLVENFWTITGPNNDSGCEAEVGFRVRAWDTLNNLVLDEVHTTTISAGKNEVVTGTTNAPQHIDNANTIQLDFHVDQLSPNGWAELTAWSNVACAMRNSRVQ